MTKTVHHQKTLLLDHHITQATYSLQQTVISHVEKQHFSGFVIACFLQVEVQFLRNDLLYLQCPCNGMCVDTLEEPDLVLQQKRLTVEFTSCRRENHYKLNSMLHSLVCAVALLLPSPQVGVYNTAIAHIAFYNFIQNVAYQGFLYPLWNPFQLSMTICPNK